MHEIAVTVDSLLSSRLLIIAPHMDDEILGCGGLMLMHEDRRCIHCIYVTDGAKSPRPLLPWQGKPDVDLVRVRRRESMEALQEVGLPPENSIYLDLPDGRLSRLRKSMERQLEQEILRIGPDFVLVPFRFDLHSDHVAIHRALRNLGRRGRVPGTIVEYFVYFRWRMISGGDIRQAIHRDMLMQLDTSGVAASKRRALLRYQSQISKLYSWQPKPVLTVEALRQRCEEPENFMVSNPAAPLTACFDRNRVRILLVHYLERFGKRRKDQILAFFRWAGRRFWRARKPG